MGAILWGDEAEDRAEELARSMIQEHFPEFFTVGARCPQCCETKSYSVWSNRETSLFAVVIHLNDAHKWNRNRIADWLDGLDIDLTFQVPSDL